jgi:hypothetical protein
MWYVPWLHWTVALWVVGEPASHEVGNRLLARFPGLRDLHPGNVVVGRRGAVVIDFSLRSCPLPASHMAPHAAVLEQQLEQARPRSQAARAGL